MKRVLLTGAVLTLISVLSACGEAKKATVDAATAEKEVRAVNEEYDRAMKQQDAAAIEKLYAEDTKVVESNGKLLTKADVIATAKAGETKYDEGQSSDITVRVHGDTAVVNGKWTQKGTVKGQAFAGALQYTTVYMKHDGKWQVISDQVTPITN